jgi:hypothetical protein
VGRQVTRGVLESVSIEQKSLFVRVKSVGGIPEQHGGKPLYPQNKMAWTQIKRRI